MAITEIMFVGYLATLQSASMSKVLGMWLPLLHSTKMKGHHWEPLSGGFPGVFLITV